MERLAKRTIAGTISSAVLVGVLFVGGGAQAQEPTAVERMGPSHGSSALGSRPDEEVSPELYLTGNEIRRIKQALAGTGEDVGPIDGRWGPRADAAVQRFQQKQGLEETGGTLNRETLQALGVDLSGAVGSAGSGTMGTAGISVGSPGTVDSAGAGSLPNPSGRLGDGGGVLSRGLSNNEEALGRGVGALGSGTNLPSLDPRTAAGNPGRPSIGTGGSPGTSGAVGSGDSGLPPSVGSPGADGHGTRPPSASFGGGSIGNSGSGLRRSMGSFRGGGS